MEFEESSSNLRESIKLSSKIPWMSLAQTLKAVKAIKASDTWTASCLHLEFAEDSIKNSKSYNSASYWRVFKIMLYLNFTLPFVFWCQGAADSSQ